MFLGRLKDHAGAAEMAFRPEWSQLSLSEIVAALAQENAELGEALSAATVRVAINKTLIQPGDNPLVQPDDELAFLPPMSGG